MFGELPKIYHLVALVELKYSKTDDLLLDESKIFFLKKGENKSQKKELNKELTSQIWNSTDD